MGWGGSEFFLAESQSRLYPYMRAKFGRYPTAVSKKVPFNFISRFHADWITCFLLKNISRVIFLVKDCSES